MMLHTRRVGPWIPWVTVPLGLLLLVFIVGQMRLARRSAVDRPFNWQFLGGWAVLILSLVSPLHEGGERSFALHMTEHELIMLVATSLLAASNAGGILAWGLPQPVRRLIGGSWKSPLTNLWKRLTEPLTATLIQAVASCGHGMRPRCSTARSTAVDGTLPST